ncbi:MAG TPA: 23S rRNA pseudouridine(1911/1915/1917) synthase RluD [Woeseiaceae bacterium]|nr:23S rRNA pseudouridine(1911/1915/1917) synthase RluD [Woeseiaceae bacterium]
MSRESLKMTVPEALAGLRLDQALAEMFPDYSRSRLKSWLLKGDVLVDGQTMRPRDKVDGGEEVWLNFKLEVAVRSVPQPIDLEVMFEDEALLVINKPAGLVVHPGAGNPSGTLMNGLLHHAATLEELPRAGIIHRIDKETTGLLLVAKTLPAHTALVRALAQRDISRRYLAVCNGVLTGGGRIDEPIGRHPTDRTRMAVVSNGKPAVTKFTVKERFRGHTYVDVALETGRTHQIRVHFAHRRRPLLGDPVYGGRLALPKAATEALITELRQFKRQALHAARLEFQHPLSGDVISIDAPLPPDFAALLEVLRQDAACM